MPPAAARTWTYLESEPTGLANLARVHPLGTTLNTVFARTTLVARAAGARAMDSGFSDRAVVYLNGQPIFAGRDDYRSRDYRFLGSIGYWDTLFLPLVEGNNELVVAVSESFGGWGLMASPARSKRDHVPRYSDRERVLHERRRAASNQLMSGSDRNHVR